MVKPGGCHRRRCLPRPPEGALDGAAGGKVCTAGDSMRGQPACRACGLSIEVMFRMAVIPAALPAGGVPVPRGRAILGLCRLRLINPCSTRCWRPAGARRPSTRPISSPHRRLRRSWRLLGSAGVLTTSSGRPR